MVESDAELEGFVIALNSSSNLKTLTIDISITMGFRRVGVVPGGNPFPPPPSTPQNPN